MSQSLTAIYIHAIFRTKYGRNLIDDNIEKELHSYIGGILKNHQCAPIQINSMPDYAHLLFRLSKNYSISQIMEYVKKESSKWIKPKGYLDFAWQNGYAAYSVSQSKVEVVANYIRRQKEHLKKISLQDEVERFMKEYKVDQYSKDFFWS